MAQYNIGERQHDPRLDAYYSVEFLLNEPNILYQFKLWKLQSNVMFALVKKNSAILDELNVGDVLSMKYYSSDALYPTENKNTRIKYITVEEHGRFKGHCLIGLEWADSEKQINIH